MMRLYGCSFLTWPAARSSHPSKPHSTRFKLAMSRCIRTPWVSSRPSKKAFSSSRQPSPLNCPETVARSAPIHPSPWQRYSKFSRAYSLAWMIFPSSQRWKKASSGAGPPPIPRMARDRKLGVPHLWKSWVRQIDADEVPLPPPAGQGSSSSTAWTSLKST